MGARIGRHLRRDNVKGPPTPSAARRRKSPSATRGRRKANVREGRHSRHPPSVRTNTSGRDRRIQSERLPGGISTGAAGRGGDLLVSPDINTSDQPNSSWKPDTPQSTASGNAGPIREMPPNGHPHREKERKTLRELLCVMDLFGLFATPDKFRGGRLLWRTYAECPYPIKTCVTASAPIMREESAGNRRLFHATWATYSENLGPPTGVGANTRPRRVGGSPKIT